MKAAQSLAKMADLLDVSIDYLMLRTDDPKPCPDADTEAVGWKTGRPKDVGDYVVVYGLPKAEDSKTSSEKIMWWDGFDFVNKKSRVAQLDGMNIYRWIRLPEPPKEEDR